MKSIINLLMLLVSVSAGFAATINVPAESATIQAGIETSTDGDTILVASGTYVENINFLGKDIVVLSVSGPELTIIDGNANGSTVTISTGELTAVLDGFTITNGSGTPNDAGHHMGGGIACRFGSNSTLMNLIVEGNNAVGDTAMGGGILISVGSEVTLEDVIIRNNEADYGGGLVAYEANPTLLRVEVCENHARVTGGGLTFWDSGSELHEVLVYDNSARYMAAGIWVHNGGTPLLNKVTITGNFCTYPNMASISAGGLGVSTGSNPILTNSIIWDNYPNSIEFYHLTDPNTIAIFYSDIEGGQSEIETNGNGTVTWGSGNINIDPSFTDSGDNDYSLSNFSPCIDAGEALIIHNFVVLLNMQEEEYCGSAPDMGAWEYLPNPEVITVPGDYSTIQAAISAAANSDTIMVSTGTYVENIDFLGKDIVVLSVSGPELTIIDGNANGSTVTIASGEATAVLDGFTITNGSGILNEYNHYIGAGIACRFNSTPTLRNLIVEGNIAPGDTAMAGGIMCAYGSDALIEDVIIRNNEADYAGGFCAYESSPTLRRVKVYGNHARVTGGGLNFWDSDSEVDEMLVYDNTARFMAAGIWVHSGGAPILNKVTITQNTCTYPNITSIIAGGLGVSTGSNPTLTNSIIWDNYPNSIEFYSSTASNTIGIMYSDIEGGESGVETNGNGTVNWAFSINADPLFCDPDSDIYTLAESSPCSGAESGTYPMGALGVGCTDPVALDDNPTIPNQLILHQNYPNPFNPSTTISFDLPEAGQVSLIIYDIMGRTVMTLFQGNQVAGYHSVNWNAKDVQGHALEAGIYLYELSFSNTHGSEFHAVKKFSILK